MAPSKQSGGNFDDSGWGCLHMYGKTYMFSYVCVQANCSLSHTVEFFVSTQSFIFLQIRYLLMWKM